MPQERMEAEKTYVRRVMRELAAATAPVTTAPQGEGCGAPPVPTANVSAIYASLKDLPTLVASSHAAAEVLAAHPRFATLYRTFGAMLTPSTNGGTGAIANQEVLTVKLRSMAAGSIEKDPVQKKLPATFQVGKLKQLFKRLFDQEPELQTLYFESGDKQSGMVPTFLDDDDAGIGFFGVSDGCTIFMNEIDLKQKEQEKEARVAEQKRREEEQEKRLHTMQAMKTAERGAELEATKQAAAQASSSSSSSS